MGDGMVDFFLVFFFLSLEGFLGAGGGGGKGNEVEKNQ